MCARASGFSHTPLGAGRSAGYGPARRRCPPSAALARRGRRPQRRGVPFAAGILQENDLDYPVAAALAAEVVSQGAFQPVGEDTFRRALAALEGCPRAVCCLESFGPLNDCNRRLAQAAGGKLVPLEEI